MGTSLKGRDPPGHLVGARNEGCCTGIKSEAELGNLQTTPAVSNNKAKAEKEEYESPSIKRSLEE